MFLAMVPLLGSALQLMHECQELSECWRCERRARWTGERKLVEGGGQSVGPSYVSALNFGSLLD